MFIPPNKILVDCYADADFSGLWLHENPQDPIYDRGRNVFVVIFSNCPLLWISNLQTEIALYILHYEFVVLYHSLKEIPPVAVMYHSVRYLLPLKSLIKEVIGKLGMNIDKLKFASISTFYEENNVNIFVSTSPSITPTSNHIVVKMGSSPRHPLLYNSLVFSKTSS